MPWQDPIVAEIHQYREAYAKQFNYDVWAINADLKVKQRQYEQDGWRVVSSREMSPPEKENQSAVALISGLQILPVSNEIIEIVEVYINHKVMPAEPTGDALHLATAAYYKMDILLTWNCKHIANVKKLDHIRRVNANLGLTTPLLITPLNLIGEDYDRH